MDSRAILRRVGLVAGICLYFVLTYKGVQALALSIEESYVPLLPGEEHIPFVAPSFLVYCSIYLVFPLLFFVIKKEGQVLKTGAAFVITTLIHYAFFLALPVRSVLRPDLTTTSDTLEGLIGAFYLLDAPNNNFPSLHVSFAFLCYFCVRRYRPRFATPMLVMAIAVSASTLFVKQHYVADVLAAIPVAIAVNYFFLERFKKVAPVDPSTRCARSG